MIEIDVHEVIANEAHKWWWCWDDKEGVFSLDAIKSIIEGNPDENDFRFNIHCPGGEVAEGFAIYDYLRSSGKNLYTNIEGDCHSMAVTLLLVAPLNQRTAAPNCSALIHQVRSGAGGTADEIEREAEATRALQERMLNIYADRTGRDYAELEAMMKEEKIHSAQELLDWGFIGSINTYNTNHKNPKNQSVMGKAKNLKQTASDFINSIISLVGGKSKDDVQLNYEFTGEDGTVLFTTEEEDDTLVAGETKASPDGTFKIADGRTVTIEGGIVTEIKEAETPAPEEQPAEEPENQDDLQAQLDAANARNAELEAKLVEAAGIIKDLRANVKSEAKTPKRQNNVSGKPVDNAPKTAADYKDAIKGARGAKKTE